MDEQPRYKHKKGDDVQGMDALLFCWGIRSLLARKHGCHWPDIIPVTVFANRGSWQWGAGNWVGFIKKSFANRFNNLLNLRLDGTLSY